MTRFVGGLAAEHKARYLVASGHVHVLNDREVEVLSHHGSCRFRVIAATDRESCTCAAGERGLRCSHVIAARIALKRAALPVAGPTEVLHRIEHAA